MDQLDTLPGKGKTGVIVLVIVVVGLVLVGFGGYLVYKKKNSNGHGQVASDAEVGAWCAIRKEWARAVKPLVGDILLKSVRQEDKQAREALVLKRNSLCREYAEKIVQLKVTNPALQRAEMAMAMEGKSRANTSVEIANVLTKIDIPDTSTLRANRDKLARYIKRRILTTRAKAESEVAAALEGTAAGKPCQDVFQATVTDEGTSASPYVSWDELELMRVQALRRYEERIKEMEPVEEFTNRVFHRLVATYRKTLRTCYRRAKARNPDMSEKMGLRIRLKPDGKVATLAIEWMANRDEKILDCLLNTASKWKLPRPDPETDVVVVSLDLSSL